MDRWMLLRPQHARHVGLQPLLRLPGLPQRLSSSRGQPTRRHLRLQPLLEVEQLWLAEISRVFRFQPIRTILSFLTQARLFFLLSRFVFYFRIFVYSFFFIHNVFYLYLRQLNLSTHSFHYISSIYNYLGVCFYLSIFRLIDLNLFLSLTDLQVCYFQPLLQHPFSLVLFSMNLGHRIALETETISNGFKSLTQL